MGLTRVGLFQNKQPSQQPLPDDELTEGVSQYFDGYFAELNERGRAYFEEAINEKIGEFKKDLDLTVAKTSVELKDYLTKRIDEQFVGHAMAMKDAQDAALQTITQNVEVLQKQHSELSATLEEQFAQSASAIKTSQAAAIDAMNKSTDKLDEQQRVLSASFQKNIARQDAAMNKALEDNTAQLGVMKQSQDTALEWLNKSIQSLQEQQQALSTTLQENVKKQENMMIDAFENNMATIIEHYLLGALGDQYDISAQLPSIIKQMESSKQAIADDMKL